MFTMAGISGTSKATIKKTIKHQRTVQIWKTTYKKATSSALKGAIQLGIMHTVGSLNQKTKRDLLIQDFLTVESISFPSKGSNLTPAHHYNDFVFKTYAPIGFRYFRELFSTYPDDYLCSICSESLIELPSPGAKGSLSYVSADEKFIIKTLQHEKADFLQRLLPGYFMNISQNKDTLLPKFYGLYCMVVRSKKILIVVINNLLPQAMHMHLKYELKGFTYKRHASAKERKKAIPTYKDLDFIQDMPDGLLLESEKYNTLIKTIKRDCLVLQSFKIMDYSLLIGIHNMDQASHEYREHPDKSLSAEAITPDQRRAPCRKARYNTAKEFIQGEARGRGALDSKNCTAGIPACNTKWERLLIYIGITDILQSYRFTKKLKHLWKALVHDGDAVSWYRPGFYAEHFERFVYSTVFRQFPSIKEKLSQDAGGLQSPNTVGRALSLQSHVAVKRKQCKQQVSEEGTSLGQRGIHTGMAKG